MKKDIASLTDQIIVSKIHMLRGQKVMLDQDLAELYKVETKRLNEQVKRNKGRFPADFMFQLTKQEFADLKSQFATSSWGGRRVAPYVFTEHGVLMLSSVLKSNRATEVNIQIMRLFIKMRKFLMSQNELFGKVENLEKLIDGHSVEIMTLFKYVKKLIQKQQVDKGKKSRKRIGY